MKSTSPTKISFRGRQLPVIVQEDIKKGYWVSCPVISGCYSQGDTIDEALKNIREAIELCLEAADREDQKAALQNASMHFVTL